RSRRDEDRPQTPARLPGARPPGIEETVRRGNARRGGRAGHQARRVRVVARGGAHPAERHEVLPGIRGPAGSADGHPGDARGHGKAPRPGLRAHVSLMARRSAADRIRFSRRLGYDTQGTVDAKPHSSRRTVMTSKRAPGTRAWISIVVLLAIAVGAGPWASIARAADPIKIGLGMALTGGLAANGKPALMAMQMWAEDVNKKGGLLGRQVQLIYYDDQTKPATVPAIYSKLLDVDKVDIVMSGYGTNMIAPAMPIV